MPKYNRPGSFDDLMDSLEPMEPVGTSEPEKGFFVKKMIDKPDHIILIRMKSGYINENNPKEKQNVLKRGTVYRVMGTVVKSGDLVVRSPIDGAYYVLNKNGEGEVFEILSKSETNMYRLEHERFRYPKQKRPSEGRDKDKEID